jgi:hypothetical protein
MVYARVRTMALLLVHVELKGAARRLELFLELGGWRKAKRNRQRGRQGK